MNTEVESGTVEPTVAVAMMSPIADRQLVLDSPENRHRLQRRSAHNAAPE